MKLKILTFEQPIGEFALTVMPLSQILSIAIINRRLFDVEKMDTVGGPQREPSTRRVNEIAEYSESSDATFPTPILLAIPEGKYSIQNNFIELNDNEKVASVVDGQHRLLGLEKSKERDNFVLPVVFILDANEEQKALIFAIINGKQTKVSGSLIFDLFSVVEGRSPFKTAHEIARALNADDSSPFQRRLKMLGKKIEGSNETLSQGTFISHLLPHISSNAMEDFNRARKNQPFISRANSVFNKYFIDNKDEIILKILSNLFNAARQNFPEEWNDSETYILAKTTGYTGIMRALPEIIHKGNELKDLSFDFFDKLFSTFKAILDAEGIKLTSEFFPAGSIGESRFRDRLLHALNSF
jgi:DGQHR domain-containing protein